MLHSRLCDFDWPYFDKMMRSHQKAGLRQRLQHLFFKKLRSLFPQIKTCHFFFVSLEIANAFSSQSALRIFSSRLSTFSVLSLEVVIHHLSLLSQHCIAYRMSDWSNEMEEGALYRNTRVEISLHVFPLTLGPARKSTLPHFVFICAKSNTITFRLRRGNEPTDGESNINPRY